MCVCVCVRKVNIGCGGYFKLTENTPHNSLYPIKLILNVMKALNRNKSVTVYLCYRSLLDHLEMAALSSRFESLSMLDRDLTWTASRKVSPIRSKRFLQKGA